MPATRDPAGAPDVLPGYEFRDPELLEQALTHGSLNLPGGTATYERLEFVGDRVLALVIADLLAERFPEDNEGQLARRHSILVSEDTLAGIGDALSLSRFIRAGNSSNAAERRSVIADCCEAVIGALYRDGGLAPARAFIARHWDGLVGAEIPKVPATDLQEWLQMRGLPLPEYRVVDRTGTDHEPEFTIEVAASGLKPVRAKGPSKRIARARAAEKMLEQIGGAA